MLPPWLADALKDELGPGLPPPLDALAHCPGGLAAAAGLLRDVLWGGKLPRTTKELIALAALAAAEVAPWRDRLREALLRRGVAQDVVDDLERKGETTRLPERTQQVVAFGRRAALQPALLGDADYQRLRKLGLDDAELAELLALAGLLALLVTWSRALAVPR